MSDNESNYKYFYSKGKRLFKDGRFKESLEFLKKAFSINPSEDLQIKINKIEVCLEDKDKEELEFKADENKLLINEKYYVDAKYYNKLYDYQKEGVTWLFKVFQEKRGCILADDMGLGKTVQIIFYLRELFESEMIKSALIIMPKSLLINWEREVKVWAPSITLLTYLGNDRDRNLKKIQKRGGIMLTTYGTIMHSWEHLNSRPDFKWGVLALDEGHKIKNPSSKTFKSINTLKADFRIIMTGTAVQNNLKELWALLQFTHQGSLLGSYPTFNREYEKPITDSRKKDASQNEKLYGDQIAMSLKKLIKPYFLRRTKEEVMKQLDKGEDSIPMLSNKNDIVVWISMTKDQIEFYKKLLEFDEVKIRLLKTEKRSPLLELNVLKKICDHPRLLNPDHCSELGLEFFNSINEIDIDTLISESGKMTFLVKLVTKMIEEDRKCLIFSQSKVILTIIQRILRSLNIKLLRLDGDTLKAEERQSIVDSFNGDSKIKILLLTSQVGGVGLTLTGADRVIIYDLNWNPSVDAQSVDRVYRIGQKKDVIIYRLITCGTVEEKIYRRQIFKDSLNRQTTGIKKSDNNSYRYFTQNELFELFTLGDPYKSDTQMQLDEMHSHERKRDKYLDDHINWLCKQEVFGISHHDLLFTQEDEAIQVDPETKEKLMVNMMQAENILMNEANLKASVDEVQLGMLMNKMSLLEPKSKVKEKYLKKDMFIPNRDDIKRPTLNLLSKRPVQTVLDNFISINKTSSTHTQIDLTKDFQNQIMKQTEKQFYSDYRNTTLKNQLSSKRTSENYNFPIEVSSEDDDAILTSKKESFQKDYSNIQKIETSSSSDEDDGSRSNDEVHENDYQDNQNEVIESESSNDENDSSSNDYKVDEKIESYEDDDSNAKDDKISYSAEKSIEDDDNKYTNLGEESVSKSVKHNLYDSGETTENESSSDEDDGSSSKDNKISYKEDKSIIEDDVLIPNKWKYKSKNKFSKVIDDSEDESSCQSHINVVHNNDNQDIIDDGNKDINFGEESISKSVGLNSDEEENVNISVEDDLYNSDELLDETIESIYDN